jgi:broad specificity phosphatase PhoE
MGHSTQLYLVRHGAVQNPRRLFYGRMPGFPLSEKGCRQAQAAAEALRTKPLAAVFSSPQQRARETAQIIAAVHDGLPVRLCDLIDEIRTPYDGLPLQDVAERGWEVYAGNEPPHEQPPDVLERMQRFISEMRQHYAGQHVVAVTHGDPITFVMLWIKGMPVTSDNRALMYQQYAAKASITRLSCPVSSAHTLPVVDYTVPYQRDARLLSQT